MQDLQVKTYTGNDASLNPETIEKLKQSIRGKVLTPESEQYNEARTIWNAMIDKRPALIVRCAGAADVMRAVRFAAEHKLLVAVRGGGHNIAGNAVCDGGLMIDLSPMKSVRIDTKGMTARVEPGVTLGEFDRDTQAFGLATPVGINSTTGIAGLTLGGGFGWLSRKLGLTIDNLISADVVTAAGELVTASETDHPDLFWGIRGGGGNFGVVTSFEFRLHKVGPEVLAGFIVHPLDAAGDVLRFYRDFVKTTPQEFVCWFVLRLAPPLPFLPAEWHGKAILILAVCYAGDLKEGERVAKPLRSFGKPVADIIGPMPFTAWQTVLDPLLTPGMRNYWKSHDFKEVSDGLIDALLSHARRLPDPQTEIAFALLGEGVTKVAKEATAYTHRDAGFVLNVHTRWDNPSNDAKCIGWARELFQATAPFATGGAYVNFMTQEEQDRVRSAYGSNYRRLATLKKKYDPKNLFRLNQNIQPGE
ncbi:MAG: FAD-binding oxidoreductase [Spirochaetia bacterium]|jgi:FAD/FMN-containing dehydrogenase